MNCTGSRLIHSRRELKKLGGKYVKLPRVVPICASNVSFSRRVSFTLTTNVLSAYWLIIFDAFAKYLKLFLVGVVVIFIVLTPWTHLVNCVLFSQTFGCSYLSIDFYLIVKNLVFFLLKFCVFLASCIMGWLQVFYQIIMVIFFCIFILVRRFVSDFKSIVSSIGYDKHRAFLIGFFVGASFFTTRIYLSGCPEGGILQNCYSDTFLYLFP